MSTITPADFAKAIIRQKKLTDSEWQHRCDELFEQQRVMFLELATFARDGATINQYRAIIDFLSELQFLSAGVSKAAAAPVGMPEFQEAVKRAVLFFNTLETNDRQDSERMAAAWIAGMTQKSEPVIWAACVETLQQHEILSSPLAVEMGITLYAVADAFSRRLASLAAPAPTRGR
jgi:hypothetical protein